VMPDALAFPRGLAVVRALRAAAGEGKLPPECSKAWIDTGVHKAEVYVKLFVTIPDDWAEREEHGEITQAALKTQAAVVGFLKARPEFARASVGRTGSVGIRDGGRVCGDYCLTAADVRQARKFQDAACRCCWPIEYWDPDEGVSLEYLPDGSWYDIPLRALKVQGLSNVWVAGKCLSADPLAQASARVVGTCWSMGEAVGKAAAQM
jgi:FAD dependent oxidoreductase